jgi:DNA polymerase III subunit delta
MADLKPVYLVAGDDDAKIDAWRARLRRRAEEELGPGGLEVFDARASDPEEVTAELAALTFAGGTRYLLVEDAGAWKAAQLGPLEKALADMAPDTVLVLIVRGRPLKQLPKAVRAAGGEVRECPAPKPWQLPKWVAERAREEGLQLDEDVAKELISAVGPGQQRLARELEKLRLAVHPSTRVSAEDVAALAGSDAEPQAYDLADAVVAGDLPAALAHAENLEAHGERPGRLVYTLARRLREVQRAAALLETGVAEQEVAGRLKAPPWLAKKTVARAKRSDRAALERALCVLADLEIELRGGSAAQGGLVGPALAVDEEVAFSLALARAAD